MVRVAIYARVSSEDQAERGTIENQLEFANKYCDLHQLEIVDWYKDDGVTGTIPLESRPEGQRLLKDAQAGRFELLLIYRLDRLGRSARIILNAVHELEQHGIKIRSMTEPFDTGDPNGRFLLTVLAGVADLERETILERMWHGANRAARAGKWLGGIVPYGYRVNEEGFLEISEAPLPGMDMSEADVVRLIFHLVADQGYSTIKVADYLNALGVPTAYAKDGRKITRGKRKVNTAGIWRPSRVRSIIRNTTYKGEHYYGKRSNKNRDVIYREVPAIVSKETWEKAQEVLKNNQIEALRNTKRKYLLRGLIKCGICGLNYHGNAYPGPERKPKAYYICNGKIVYRGPLQGKCPSKNLPAEWIEELIWNNCVEFINNPGVALQELSETMEFKKSQRDTLELEKQKILSLIEDKESEKQSILDLYRKKIISSLDVEQQLQKIIQEKQSLEERVRDLDRQIAAEEEMLKQFDTPEQLLADLKSKLNSDITFEIKRDIVKTLVKEIIVDTKYTENERPYAVITARFNFFKDVVHTDKRENNNLDFLIERKIKAPVWLNAYTYFGDTTGARLRKVRVHKGLTIKDLAEMTKISRASIIRFEAGENPSIMTLRKLAKALGVKVAYLGCFESLPENTLGQRITKARLYHGLTKREFAAKLGTDEKIVRQWEQDKHVPSKKFIDKINHYLKILDK